MGINLDVVEHVGVVTIDFPEKLNALDAAAYRALSEAWIRVRDDGEIRAAIITGAGDRAFCVGADIKNRGSEDDLGGFWRTQEGLLLNRGLEIWKPVVAAVNGYCLGGGMTLLLATDIRVATTAATFGLAEVKRGILAGNGGTQRILQQLPHAIAMEALLTGDSVTAETAERWGLINRVVDHGNLMSTAWEYARRITKNAPLAVQATKEAAIRSRELGWSSGLRLEQALNRLLQFTSDSKEGPAAFVQRRDPKFEGR